MQPADLFKELIKNIASLLKEHKYKRYGGNVFYTNQQGNWGFIGFQKSMGNTYYETRFTINLGIFSTILQDFFDPEKKPSLYECRGCWKYRIGHLVPDYDYDKWWSITEETIPEQIIQEIRDILITHAIPEIERNISDKQLLNTWLTGKLTGITHIQRLTNLSVLLKHYGMENQLKPVLDELQQYLP